MTTSSPGPVSESRDAANASVAPAVVRMAPRGHLVITNSWVLNYLSPTRQEEYVRELNLAGVQRDLSRTPFSSQGPVEWKLEHYKDGLVDKPEVCAFNFQRQLALEWG